MPAPRLYNLIAELTYRCPLQCPYCSNPLALADFPESLDAAAWVRVCEQASELGAVHVGLTGGEPTARRDLGEIVAGAAAAGLYTHLVTAGTPVDGDGLAKLRAAGLRSVQLSVQDADPASSDALAGTACFERKRALALAARSLDLPLTLNVVLHRRNLARVGELIALAREWGAERLELANVQLHGWALRNRAALLPSRAQLREAAAVVERERGVSPWPEILFVLADYWSDRPKPCSGGWGQRQVVVSPDGRVLPCHAAGELPGLDFWRVPERDLAACWADAPGMNAFRGEDWMQEPCRTCPERGRDFGGCRCQAFALTGDAAATDPACRLSPEHGRIVAAREEAEAGGGDSASLVPRRFPGPARPEPGAAP